MTGAAEATITATAITSFFMRVLLRVWLVATGSIGWPSWPSVSFEHLLGGPCGVVCQIAFGYVVGALGDALRLLKGGCDFRGGGHNDCGHRRVANPELCPTPSFKCPLWVKS